MLIMGYFRVIGAMTMGYFRQGNSYNSLGETFKFGNSPKRIGVPYLNLVVSQV